MALKSSSEVVVWADLQHSECCFNTFLSGMHPPFLTAISDPALIKFISQMLLHQQFLTLPAHKLYYFVKMFQS